MCRPCVDHILWAYSNTIHHFHHHHHHNNNNNNWLLPACPYTPPNTSTHPLAFPTHHSPLQTHLNQQQSSFNLLPQHGRQQHLLRYQCHLQPLRTTIPPSPTPHTTRCIRSGRVCPEWCGGGRPGWCAVTWGGGRVGWGEGVARGALCRAEHGFE